MPNPKRSVMTVNIIFRRAYQEKGIQHRHRRSLLGFVHFGEYGGKESYLHTDVIMVAFGMQKSDL